MDIQAGSYLYDCMREYLLANSTGATKTARELWRGNNGTYAAYRNYLANVKEEGFPAQRQLGEETWDSRSIASSLAVKPAYAFAGMRHIFDNSKRPVTALSFGHAVDDLLAFANADGEVWAATFPGGEKPVTIQLARKHQSCVRSLDWSIDNNFLVTSSQDGTVCVWQPLAGTNVRVMTIQAAANCCRFHPLNPNLVVVGTSQGVLEVYNVSTGVQVQKHSIPARLKTEVTGLLCTNTQLFVGDSRGMLHLYRFEIKDGMLQKLSYVSKVIVSQQRAAIFAMDWLPFSSCFHSSALLISTFDNHVMVIKVMQDGTTSQLEVVRQAALPRAARPISARWCPPSVMHESDYIVTGGENMCVHIWDAAKHTSRLSKVNTLQGHNAPVTECVWSFNERHLASVDVDGIVIVWKRDPEELEVSSQHQALAAAYLAQQSKLHATPSSPSIEEMVTPTRSPNLLARLHTMWSRPDTSPKAPPTPDLWPPVPYAN